MNFKKIDIISLLQSTNFYHDLLINNSKFQFIKYPNRILLYEYNEDVTMIKYTYFIKYKYIGRNKCQIDIYRDGQLFAKEIGIVNSFFDSEYAKIKKKKKSFNQI